MRRLAPTALVLLALLVPGAAFAANTVSIEDGGYNPATITVSPGATVSWQYNNATIPHGVQFGSDAPTCQKLISPLPDCTKSFPDAGRFHYHDVGCDPSTDPTCITGEVVVYVAPTAEFTASPNPINRGNAVNFDASASTAPGGSIASYSWDFGDGSGGSGVTVGHTYPTAGTYTVRLTITDDQNTTAVQTHDVVVTVPDSDGDGFDDDHDACPLTPGIAPNGCIPPPIIAPPAIATSTTAPKLIGLSGILKNGVAAVVSCSDSCTGALTLLSGTQPVGAATVALPGGGVKLVVIPISPAGKSLLSRQKSAKLRLQTIVTDALLRVQTLSSPIQVKNVKPAGKLPAIGISDQNAATFNDPLFQVLRLKYARLVTPWNSIFKERGRLDQWLQTARAHGVRPLVAFEHARSDLCPRKPCRAPSAGQYKRAWKAFHRKYPWVKDVSPWDEVNSGTQPTGKHPELAARYYNIVHAGCRGCSVVAADVLDVGNVRGYLQAFLAKANGKPRLWGLHNYRDTNRFRQTGTRQVLAAVKGKIWFTETGGIVSFTTQGGKKALPKSESRAKRAMDFMFRLAVIDSKRVPRIYVYQWKVNFAGDRFDAGVVRPNGTPRPSYDVLTLNASIARKR